MSTVKIRQTMLLDQLGAEVLSEVHRAMNKYPEMKSPHEGYAILQEEVDELWDLVKAKQDVHDKQSMRKEAIQIAAMAVRFIYDLTREEK